MGLLLSAMLVSSCGKEEASGKSQETSGRKDITVSERLFNAEAELTRAVKANDTVALRQVIFDNPDLTLNKYLENGETLLVHAIKKKLHLIRNILLDKKALVDQISLDKDFQGQTPLMIAAHLGDAGSISALLRFGASINYQDNMGDTALHKAIKNGRDEAARALIRAGSDLQVENDLFESPLETARNLGRKEITDELEGLVNLERGAPSIAVFRQILKDGDLVNYRKLLALHSDVIKDYVFINPVLLAVESTNETASFQLVQSLLAMKFSPDGIKDAETTPLIRAVILKRKNIAELLVNAGADLSIFDSTERPALAYAITNVDEQMVELLHSNGAQVRMPGFRACRLASTTLRKLKDENEKETMKRILLILSCGRFS